MAALSELEFEEISKLLQQYFRGPLEVRLQQAEDRLKTVAQRLEDWMNSTAYVQQDRLMLREGLQAIVLAQLPRANQQTENTPEFSYFFGELQTKLDAFIAQQPELRHELQQEERFLPQPHDAALLKTSKHIKRKYRSWEAYQLRAANWLRNALGSPEKQLQEWGHEIPWQGLLRKHLQITMLHRLQELLNISERQQSVLMQTAIDLSALPDRHPVPGRTEMQQEIGQQLKKASHIRQQTSDMLHRQLEAILGRFYIELEEEYPKAGTLELPAASLKASVVHKKKQQRQQKIEAQLAAWRNTRLALLNQWLLQLMLHNCNDQLQLHLQHVQQKGQERLHTQVLPVLDQLVYNLQRVKENLSSAPLPQAFSQGRAQLQQVISLEETNSAAAALLAQDLPGQLQALENPVQQILASLPEFSLLGQPLKGREPVPVPSSGLTQVPVRELASQEILPLVMIKLLQLRDAAAQQVAEMQVQLGELQEIGLFNLDAAQSYLEQHPQDEQKSRTIALEGIERIIAQLASMQDRLRHLLAFTWQELQLLQGRIGQSLFPLSLLEQVKSLQIRLEKSRRKRAHREQPTLFQSWQAMFPQLQEQLQHLLPLGKTTPSRQSREDGSGPATALTDFLTKHEQTLLRLPFVYQRLYSLEPLTDELFLVGRARELQELQEAYRRWTEGLFSPTLICGDKGSGLTSLLNIFIKRLPQQQGVCRIQLGSFPADEQALASILANAMGMPQLNSLAMVEQQLLKMDTPLMFVVEDLQQLFRRWVGGFEIFNAFVALVARTSHAVFWLCSCSLYSWLYLSRATKASENWSRIISLDQFAPEELSELLLRRQRISGYQLQFAPGPQEIGNKRFGALPEDEQQAQLELKFFYKLAAFSQYNPRLALLYWLSATASVSQDQVVVSTALNPDFSDLEALPPVTYFYLHALLIHDTLQAGELARILNTSENTAGRQLQMLAENGLLHSRQNSYSLHPLLYHQLVRVLKHKNLLN